MKKILYIMAAGIALLFNSCVGLDVPPNNVVTKDQLLGDESGLDIYFANIYSQIPFEDFKYRFSEGFTHNGWLVSFGTEGIGEGVGREGFMNAWRGEGNPYWGQAFKTLREINQLIRDLPTTASNLPGPTLNQYLGDAYYCRATIFYAMARRYGGIPLVTKVIDYPAESDELEVPRSSEEDTWKQILADYDKAAELMGPISLKDGYANKYVALSWKSEAALYAACVAKYNQTVTGHLTGVGQKTGVRVMGFDDSQADKLASQWFKEAYLAAKEVISSGRYSLYKKGWEAGNKDAIMQSMVNMLSDTDSPENIQTREYSYPTYVHSYDSYNTPCTIHSPLSGGTCPTADFISLFDGIPVNADGSIKTTDAQGNYVLYDNPFDFFKNAEPRLRAQVIVPGDVFRGKVIEIRQGIYTGSEPIKPLFSTDPGADYSYGNASKGPQTLKAYTDKPKTLYMCPNQGTVETVDVNGVKTQATGVDGPFYSWAEGGVSGMYSRKWLYQGSDARSGEGVCDQHFILMRYAEVLLNFAEAAVELSLQGVSSPDGADMLAEASEAIRAIQERAGANIISNDLTSNEKSRNIVRKERRKELAFEQKTKYDLRRWRVQDYDNRDGFWGITRDKDVYSDNSRYRFHGLYPYMSAQSGKYFFDYHYQYLGQNECEFNAIDYYFAIPGGEVSKSPVIDQQPNR